MDSGAWWATVRKVAEADMAEMQTELQQQREEDTNTQLPLLKGWEQKQEARGKSRACACPLHLAPPRGGLTTEPPVLPTPCTPRPSPCIGNQLIPVWGAIEQGYCLLFSLPPLRQGPQQSLA